MYSRFRLPLILLVFLLHVALTAQTPEPFWIPTNGPTGGIMNCLYRTSSGTLLAGMNLGGMYRSTDRGRSWTSPALRNYGTSVFTFIQDGAGRLFAGTGSGVYKSNDDGQTWIQSSSGLLIREARDRDRTLLRGEYLVTAFAFDRSGSILAGRSDPGGIFKSTDGGDSWFDLKVGRDDVSDIIVRGDTIIAGLSRNARLSLRSTDNGATWSYFTPIPGTASGLKSVAVIGESGTEIIALSRSGKVWRGLFADTTWTSDSLNLSLRLLKPNGDGGVIAWGDSGVFLLERGESKWNRLLPHNTFFAAQTQGTEFFTQAVDARFHVYDAVRPTTDVTPTGIASSYVAGMCVMANNRVAARTGTVGWVTTSDGGVTWIPFSTGRTSLDSVLTSLRSSTNGEWLVAQTEGGDPHVVRMTWRLEPTEAEAIPLPPSAPTTANPIAEVTNTGTVLLRYSDVVIFKYPVAGTEWIRVNTPGSTRLRTFLHHNGVFYLGDSLDWARSTDEGETWEPIPTPPQPYNVVRFDNNRSDRAAMFAGDDLYVTSDSGLSWAVSRYLYGLRSISIGPGGSVAGLGTRAISTGRQVPGTWIVERNWEAEAPVDTLWSSLITSIAFAPDGRLYAATTDAGVYRSSATHVSSAPSREVTLSDATDTERVRRLVVRAGSSITFAVPHDATDRVTVYDLRGQVVGGVVTSASGGIISFIRGDASPGMYVVAVASQPRVVLIVVP